MPEVSQCLSTLYGGNTSSFQTYMSSGNPTYYLLDSDSLFSNVHRPTLNQRFEGSSLTISRILTLFVALSSPVFCPENSSHFGLRRLHSLFPQFRETTGLCLGSPYCPAAWKLLLVHKLRQSEVKLCVSLFSGILPVYLLSTKHYFIHFDHPLVV